MDHVLATAAREKPLKTGTLEFTFPANKRMHSMVDGRVRVKENLFIARQPVLFQLVTLPKCPCPAFLTEPPQV